MKAVGLNSRSKKLLVVCNKNLDYFIKNINHRIKFDLLCIFNFMYAAKLVSITKLLYKLTVLIL
jgi:hypothetical protein